MADQQQPPEEPKAPSPKRPQARTEPQRLVAGKPPDKRGPPPSPAWARLTGDPVLAIVFLVAIVVPLLAVPADSPHWRGVRGLIVEAGSVLMLGAALWRLRAAPSLRRALAFAARGPNPWLLSLVVLGVSSCLTSHNGAFARQGLLQLAGGALVYGLVAHQTRTRAQFELLLDALIATTILASVAGFALFGGGGAGMAVGTFGDHQLFGAFLMLLLPVMLVTGFSPTAPTRRLAAQAASVLALSGLLLARTRASWIGEALSLLILAALSYRYLVRTQAAASAGARRQRLASWASGLTVLIAVVAFVGLSQMGDSFSRRAQSMTAAAAGRDGSFQSRLPAWRGALAMVRARPVTGWGIGSYPLAQEPFTHVGRGGAAVAALGPSLSEQAHDFYLQLAAELGLPGLLLWLGALAAACAAAKRALAQRRAGSLRQRVLIGALAAAAGQAVDALANPAWQFSEVMLFFWIVLGLGMAAAGLADGLPPGGAPEAWTAPARPWALSLRRCGRLAAIGLATVAAVSEAANIAWVLPAAAYAPPPTPGFELGGCYSNGSYTLDGEQMGSDGTHNQIQVGITTDVSGENHRLVDPKSVSSVSFVLTGAGAPYLSRVVNPGGVTATITYTNPRKVNISGLTATVTATFTSSGGKPQSVTNSITLSHP